MSANPQSTATLAAFRTLKGQFEAGVSEYPRLSHLLSQSPDQQPGMSLGPFPVRDCTRPEQAIATRLPSTQVTFRVTNDMKWTPNTGPLDRGVFVKPLPHFNRGWGRDSRPKRAIVLRNPSRRRRLHIGQG